MSRIRLTSLNFGSSMLLRVVSILVSVAATPLLLAWLGKEVFGAFKAVFDWYGYLALLEMGFEGALIPLMIEAITKKNKGDATRILAAGLRLFLMLTVAKAVVGIALVLSMPQLVAVSFSATELISASFIGLLSVAFTGFAPFRVLIRSEQKSYQITWLLMLQTLVITGLSLYFAWLGEGLTGQFVALLLGLSVMHFGMLACALKSPQVEWSSVIPLMKLPVSHEIKDLNRPTFLMDAANRIAASSDVVIATYFLGPLAMVPMFLSQRFPQLVQMVVQEIANSSWASLSDLWAAGHKEVFAERMQLLTKLVAAVAIAGMVPILQFNREIVTLWVGSDNYAGDSFTLIALTVAYFAGLMALWRWCFIGTKNIDQIAKITAWNAGLNIVLSCLLTRWIGIEGPVLGTVISFILTSFIVIPQKMKQVFGMELGPFYRDSLLPLLLLPLFYYFFGLIPWGFDWGWVNLFFVCAATAIASFVMTLLLILKSSERVYLQGIVAGILMRGQR